MSPEERAQHVRNIEWLYHNNEYSDETAASLEAAADCLEREGQMEARLRWIAEFSGIDGFSVEEPDTHMMTWDVQIENGTDHLNPTKDECFAGFCRMVDKAMEASNG